MCEIAILAPSRYSADELATTAMAIYRSQRSSLGLVAIRENDDRTRFLYDILKVVNPDYDDVLNFIENHQEEATRLIIHGRLATHGDVTVTNAHPIKVDCPECDVDFVLHNGVVYTHEETRRMHEKHGHDYATEVDSEVIAHDFGHVPTDFDDGTFGLHEREPAFILLSDEAVFIRNGGMYRLAEDGTMATRRREVGPGSDATYTEVILTPKNHE